MQLSPELYTRSQIQIYGVMGVMGRPLSYEEIIAMDAAAETVSIYNEMMKSQSFETWARENPRKFEIISGVLELIHGDE